MSVRSCCAVPGTVLFFLALCLPGWSAEKATVVEEAAKAEPEASCAGLVRAALLAEAAGKVQDREQLLRQAMEQDPSFAPARWHAGYVRQGDRWLTVDQAQREAAQDQRLAEYRKLREEQAFAPLGELNLARWCRDHGLTAEARVHWARVLTAQPQNAEALKALGMAWYQGQLLAEAQIEQMRKPDANARRGTSASVKEEREWAVHWETQLAKWRRASESAEAKPASLLRAELESVANPLAAQTLGTLLLTRSLWVQDRRFHQALSLTLVQWLAYLDDPWAGQELVRQALDHPLAEVRIAAVDALKKRPKETYVPWLLCRMRLPIEASGSMVSLGLGGAVYQYSLEQEGPDAVYVRNFAMHSHVKDTTMLTDRSLWIAPVAGNKSTSASKSSLATRAVANARLDAFVASTAQAARNSVLAHQQAVATLTAVQRKVNVTNTETAEINRRVQEVLAQATGAEVAENPLAWAKWWRDYCYSYYEIEYPSETDDREKPVYEDTWYGYHPLRFATRPVASASCFAWNTKVWTLTGPSNIDQIKPGDRVLARHPQTGELAYKPVLGVTRRKPSPRMKIVLGKETILATRGHPFWVCGAGWKMAKHLQAGMWLHTLCGPVAIERLEQAPAAGPWYEQLKERPDAKPEDVLSYNLVVDEFHNYFVGEGKLLVHDNILFPLDGPVPQVPGLAMRP